MDVMRGEDIHDLPENVAIELIGLFVGWADIALRAFVSLTFQHWISGCHLIAVARHLYLRHDGYALGSRVSH